VNDKKLDALLLHAQERQQRKDKTKDHQSQRLGGLQHHNTQAREPSRSSSKNKSKSTPNLSTVDPILAAKLRDSLAEPLLLKGRPVVVDTGSDYETESDNTYNNF